TNGSTVSGDVTSSVTATDNVGVERVEIRSGTRLLGTALVPSSGDTWIIPWDSWALPDGPVTYTATAYDTSGNSATVEGRVIITNPPPVDTAPAKGATVIKVSGKPSAKAGKPLTVQVPRSQPVVMRIKDPAFAGAEVSVRLGSSWVTVGKMDKKGWLPALQINGPGPYLMRLQPKAGKPGYLGIFV
ncbi:MAG: Ig-like domain-containing protein, partial [Candidatus Nanopelagicales bacterium]